MGPPQSALLKDQFTASLQAYRKAEQSYRTEQRTQLERQIKIGMIPSSPCE